MFATIWACYCLNRLGPFIYAYKCKFKSESAYKCKFRTMSATIVELFA